MQAKAAAERSAAAALAEAEEAKQHMAVLQAAPSGEAAESAITRLIQLIYFAMVGSWLPENWRMSCLVPAHGREDELVADVAHGCAALCGRWITPAPLRAERLPII